MKFGFTNRLDDDACAPVVTSNGLLDTEGEMPMSEGGWGSSGMKPRGRPRRYVRMYS